MLRSPTGAMIVVNDTGIYINNGKGASIDHDGTERDDQQSRIGGDVSMNDGGCSMPGFLLHVGATVHVRARRTGAADGAVPARDWSAACRSDAGGPYVVAGCPFVPPARQRPLRHGAMGDRRDARVSAGGMPVLLQSSVRRSARRPARR